MLKNTKMCQARVRQDQEWELLVYSDQNTGLHLYRAGFTCFDIMADSLHWNCGICECSPISVLYHTFDATVHLVDDMYDDITFEASSYLPSGLLTTTLVNSPYLLHERKQGFSVVLPLQWQLAFMWKLVTPQEDGYLKAVSVKVTEIIHA